MSRPLVAVLDYGSGNVHSAVKALAAAGADARLTSDRGLIRDADGLVVPGVGAFRAVMDALNAVRAGELIERRLAGGLEGQHHLPDDVGLALGDRTVADPDRS